MLTAGPRGEEASSPGQPSLGDGQTDPCAVAPPPIDTSARRFRSNVLANLGYLVFTAGIQLWFTRYLVENLGVAVYGLVPLATTITNYMAILTVAVSGSVARFLTADMARGDVATANRTFNTSLFASLAIALALVPLACALSWFGPSFLRIPEGEEQGTRILLACAAFAFLLNTVGSNFACSTFARNRFDVQRAIDATGYVTQVGIVLAAFALYGPSLLWVGGGIAGSALVRQACYQISWRRLTPQLRIQHSAFDRRRLSEVLSLGGWLVVNHVGGLLFLGVDLLVVNTIVGAHAAGLYAPGLQVSMLIRTLAGVVAWVLVPTYVASYATGDPGRIVRVSQRVVRILGVALAIPIGLICGLSRPLLVLWLGEEYRSVAWVLSLMVVHLSVNAAVVPMFGINQALNRVKWPGIATLVLGFVNVGVAVLLAGPVGLGLYGVAAANAVVLTAKNAVFIPAYAAHILRLPLTTFARALVSCIVATLAIAGASYGVASVLNLESWVRLLGAAAAIALAAAGVGLVAVLTPEDRRVLTGALARA